MAETEGNPLLVDRRRTPVPGASCAGIDCPALPRVHKNMIVVALCAAVSGFCFGYDIGIIDQVLAMHSFQAWSGTTSADADAPQIKGWIVSTFLFGCIGGSLCVSYLADAIGRKKSMLLGALCFCAGGVGQSCSASVGSLYGTRVLSGFSIGILSMVAPLYISETSPADVRGSLIAVQQLLITFGVLVASCVNAAIFAFGGDGDTQWRSALAMQVVPGALLFLLMLSAPPSPRWLLKQGRDAAAVAVVARLRGSTGDNADVAEEMAEMRAGVKQDKIDSLAGHGWRELFTNPSVRRPLILACLLQIAQQWTGINVILYYAAGLFTSMGIDESSASTSLVIVNAALLCLGTIPGMLLVEHRHVGRRRLLIAGGIAMTISHAGVCFAVSVSGTFPVGSEGAVALSWVAVVFMYAFTLSFAATWGPVVWVYQNEVLPLRVRALGTAVATLMNWSSNAVIGKVAPLLIEVLGAYTYAIFAVLCAAMTLFSVFAVPETQGLSLEGMAALFSSGTRDTRISEATSREIDEVPNAEQQGSGEIVIASDT